MLRLAESGHLIVVSLIGAGLSLAVGTLLASLHRLTRQRYLQYWALAWYLMSLRGVAGAASLLLGSDELPGRAVGLLALFGGYLQVPALGLAAASLRTGEPAPILRRGLAGGTVALAATLVLLAALLPTRVPDAVRVLFAVVPFYALIAAANACFGWSFARHSPRSATLAGRLVVGFSLLYAAHLLTAGFGWAGIELYGSQTASSVVGLLLPIGITTGIVLSVVDDAMEAERRLRESDATKQALLQAVPDAIFVQDRNGVFLEFLPAKGFETLVPPEQFLGRKASEVLPPELASEHQRQTARAIETGETVQFEYSLPGPNGSSRYEARLSASGPERVVAIVRDVTARTRAEAEREALIGELASKNTALEEKNVELERFSYTVSHDLKSPLVTIQGFLGYAEQALARGDTASATKDFARIRSAAEKMERLLHDLLQLSRIGRVTAPWREVSVEALVREVGALLDARVRQHGGEIRVDAGLPVVFGDPVRLREVFQNLLENAVAFSSAEPHPTVTVGSRGRDAAGHAVLFVEDNGIGIDPSHHERIFGLFETLDPARDGTGVGLTIARRIVDVHGGRIWVESQGRGHGATFCFTLPVPEAREQA